MKGRILVAALTLVAGLMVFLYAPNAQARVTPETAVESLFVELNSGKLDGALASFTEDAVARNLVRGETYTGSAEIRKMLAGMHREGRRLDVVGVRTAGEKIIVTAEISDGGLVWGVESITVEMRNGKINYYELTAIRLTLW